MIDFNRWHQRISRKPHPLVLGGVGLLVLIAGLGTERFLEARVALLQGDVRSLMQQQAQSSLAQHHFRALAELKKHDVMMFKEGMSNLAQSNKSLFEAGLSIQEERRLLEKQWEILTTYITVETYLQRVFLMRGDQPLESYLVNYVPIKAFGGLPANVPRVTRITSKERFAHPERGTSEVVNGKLQWQPPQVGTSVRSNALGEYVVFTSSRLILHGPPRNHESHEAFPHLCLGLSLEAARNLYLHSFIGTKVLLANVKEELQRQSAMSFTIPVDTSTLPKDVHGN